MFYVSLIYKSSKVATEEALYYVLNIFLFVLEYHSVACVILYISSQFSVYDLSSGYYFRVLLV